MQRNFSRALKLVLAHEGGWADHPSDPGGATMKGVTIGSYRQYVNPRGTKEDLRKITDAQLAEVYRRHYWDAVRADDLPDGVDYAVFDFAVNSGPSRAAKYVQAVVGASQDGKIGSATLKAIATANPAQVINSLCDDRLAFLKKLPTWKTFGKGWSRRVTGVRKEALTMASAAPAKAIVVDDPGPKPVPAAIERRPAPSGNWLAILLAAIAKAFGARKP